MNTWVAKSPGTDSKNVPLSHDIERLVQGNPIRRTLADGTRLHIDRPLPFICFHQPTGELRQAAYDVSTSNASYIISQNIDHATVIVNEIGEKMRERFGAFLVMEVSEFEQDRLLNEDSPHLPAFEVDIQADSDPAAQAAMYAMAAAINGVGVKYRSPVVKAGSKRLSREQSFPALNPSILWVSVRFAPVYRQVDSQEDYPDLRQRLVANLFDAVLQGIAAFTGKTGSFEVPTHRALGRSAFVNAVKKLDTQMDKICRTFDFLLAITPVNSELAWQMYKCNGYDLPPVFYYRPLTYAIDKLKRDLFSLNFDHLEDPVLYDIYREKQQEIDLQLTAISVRDTPRFLDASVLLYGAVEPELLHSAKAIFESIGTNLQSASAEQIGEYADCHQMFHAATCMVSDYQDICPEFKPEIEIRDDLPAGMMVSGHRLLISRHTRVARNRVNALLSHEIGVHLLTYFNGDAQGLRIFRSGLAGYEGTQEGLAVLSEYLVGGLTPARMRLLAGRVVGCAAMLDGADFNETFRLMVRQYDFAESSAFNLSVRLHRGGGLTKDAIYLRELRNILNHLERGHLLDAFWLGKFAESHLPMINELTARGLLHNSPLYPSFLTVDGAEERLTETRHGMDPIDLIT